MLKQGHVSKMIYATSFKHKIPENVISIDVTSRSNTWGKYFSPFNLGPVNLYDKYWSYNIENAFQFAGLYTEFITENNAPNQCYWDWAKKGWENIRPIKYPMGAWSKPIGYWWNGKLLNRLEAQNQIFIPLYKATVVKTTAYQRLKDIYETSNKDIYLVDFEGFDHRFLEKSWDQVINNPDMPVGQAFVLCMLLEGYL